MGTEYDIQNETSKDAMHWGNGKLPCIEVHLFWRAYMYYAAVHVRYINGV